jgi:hypothetical protein
MPGYSREIHGPTPDVGIANVAHVPGQSRRANHGGRFLRRAGRDLPPAVRPGHHRPQAPTRGPRGRHGPSDGGVDGATAARGISLGRGSALSCPGSRSRVRRLGEPRDRNGSRRTPQRPALSLAERVRGTLHRIGPAGSAWTTSSCAPSAVSVASWTPTSTTISARELTSRSTRMRLSRGRSRRHRMATSCDPAHRWPAPPVRAPRRIDQARKHPVSTCARACAAVAAR